MNDLANTSGIEQIIMKKRKMAKTDIDYVIHRSTNKVDILTLNYIEKSIVNRSGEDFILRSQNKIEVIVNLLLEDKLDVLYEFYLHSFDEYMQKTGNSFEGITSFNLVFMTLLHISLKIIRKSAFSSKK